MTRKKLFKVLGLILFNLVLILFLLILADPLVGMIVDEKPGNYREINFKENNPNSYIKISAFKEVENGKSVIKRTDQNGFILGPGENSKSDIDIVFLGASNVESENLPEKWRFPYLSIKMLNEKLGSDLIGRNAGVGGNLLSESNLILTTKIIDLHPEYVLLSSSLIDLLYLSKNQSYWKGSKKYLQNKDPKTSLFKSTKDYFFPNIWLQLRKYTISGDASGFTSNEFSPLDKERILNQYEKQLDVFINTCLIYNIKPILCTDYYVPELVRKSLLERNIFNTREADFYINSLIPDLNEMIAGKAQKYKIPVIELPKLIPIKEENVQKDNGIHLSIKGSKKVSEVISNYLAIKIDHEEN